MLPELRGWAPLWRRVLRSRHFKGTTPPTKLVFVWVVLHVRHRAAPQLPAGSVDARASTIATDMDLSEKSVLRALRVLSTDPKHGGFCTVSRLAHGFRITVPSWRRWMVDDRTMRPVIADSESDVSIYGSEEQDLLALVPPDQVPPDLGSRTDALPRVGRDRKSDGENPTDGYRETIDVFHRAYVAANAGAKPTWGAKQGKQIKDLIKAHGADEVQRRIGVLFSSPPSWLKPPHTLGTLVLHFDALVASRPADPRGLSAGDLFALADRMRGGGGRGGAK